MFFRAAEHAHVDQVVQRHGRLVPRSVRFSLRRVHRERDLYFVARLRRDYGTHGLVLVQHDGLKHIRDQVLKLGWRGFTNGCNEADGVGIRALGILVLLEELLQGPFNFSSPI